MSDDPAARRETFLRRRRILYRIGAAASAVVALVNVTQADWIAVGLFAALAASFLIGSSRRRET